jgi:hypothetical protein
VIVTEKSSNDNVLPSGVSIGFLSQTLFGDAVGSYFYRSCRLDFRPRFVGTCRPHSACRGRLIGVVKRSFCRAYP